MFAIKKTFLISAFLLNVFLGYAQSISGLEDFGKSTDEVKKMFDFTPCEVTQNKIITYCVEGGSRLSFLFTNDKVSGVCYQTIYLTRNQAEKALEEEVASFSKTNNLIPSVNNGNALFYMPGIHLNVSYKVGEFNNNIYLLYYTFLSPTD